MTEKRNVYTNKSARYMHIRNDYNTMCDNENILKITKLLNVGTRKNLKYSIYGDILLLLLYKVWEFFL